VRARQLLYTERGSWFDFFKCCAINTSFADFLRLYGKVFLSMVIIPALSEPNLRTRLEMQQGWGSFVVSRNYFLVKTKAVTEHIQS
jgi:hypothetical protein